MDFFSINKTGHQVNFAQKSRNFLINEYFFKGFIKDRVYIPLLPVDLFELRNWIYTTTAEMTSDVRARVGQEMYDVYLIIHVSHIKPKWL